jgi:hypothetical protein
MRGESDSVVAADLAYCLQLDVFRHDGVEYRNHFDADAMCADARFRVMELRSRFSTLS